MTPYAISRDAPWTQTAWSQALDLDEIQFLSDWNADAVRGSQATLPIDAEALRAALDSNEIKVHYQPKVDTRTGVVRGVEALERWQQRIGIHVIQAGSGH